MPQTKRTYRVAIRGEGLGLNYCSCPDFATNTLGTCKHVEFLLRRLRRMRGGKAALAEGCQPPFSEVYLRYGAQRAVVFHAGAGCPEALKALAAEFFDAGGLLRPGAVRQFHRFLAQAGGGPDGHEVRCYPGDRGHRGPGPPRRRPARPCDMPDLAEAPVASRDREVRRAAGRRGRGAGGGPREAVRGRGLLRDRQLRRGAPRPARHPAVPV
jgi:hypothetical protein